jgi:hypothetical protein
MPMDTMVNISVPHKQSRRIDFVIVIPFLCQLCVSRISGLTERITRAASA